MANTTNVPTPTFTSTGLVLPQETAILAGVQEDYNAAFGGNLNSGLNTPQGQLCSSTAAMIANGNTVFATFVNQVDPDTATGFMQDAIGRIYFMNRNPATSTTVNLVCTGAFGTTIPVGALATDTSDFIYSCTEEGEIPVGGSITLPFANVATGPLGCAANTVTGIYQAINGWESVNNPTPGVLGSNVETPAAFEYRRQQSVSKNAQGSLPAIYAACFGVTNVLDVFVTQNNTSSVISAAINGNPNITSYPVAANSVYIAVVGGDAQSVANAIWTATNVGAAYQTAAGSAGATLVTETVQDTSGYSVPVPSYTVNYINPASTPIYFGVTLASSSLLPSNIVTLVQQAIINQFTGQSQGSLRERIGAQILASRYFGPVQAIGSEVNILTITIGFNSSVGNAALQMGIDQVPTISAGNIAVAT
jgi:uncharacterized phage protein gp47/JayE